MSKSKPSNPPPKAKAPKKVQVVASSSEEESESDDEEYIFKPIHHHQHLQDAEEWNTVVNTKKMKRDERYERKKEREAEQAQALAAEQERYRQQHANNPYAKLLVQKPTPQYNAHGRKKLAPKVHKYVHSPEDEEEIVAPLTNFEKVQQKNADRSKKIASNKPSAPAVIINNETDLVNTIAGILDRSPEPYLPVATAAAELAKLTKTSWQDTYKRTYGSLATFLQSHDDTFAVIDGDKLFLKPRLEAFLQTTIGRPKKKKVKAVTEESNGTQGKKKKTKQNGVDTHEHDTDSSDTDESASSSSSSACGRCCSTLFLLIMSLVLIAIVILIFLSIKRITVAEAWAHISHIAHPYTQRIQLVTRPYVEQLAVHVTEGVQQIQARWAEHQSKRAVSS